MVVVTVVVGSGVVVVTGAVDVTVTVPVTAMVADGEADLVVEAAPGGRGVIVDAVAALADCGPFWVRRTIVGTATEAVVFPDESAGVPRTPLIKIGVSAATCAADRPRRSLVAAAI